MRILVDSPGQTCNRLWSYLDSVAWAIVHRKKVVILFWDPSISEFDKLRNHQYVSFPFYSKRIIKILGEARYLQILYYIFANPLLKFFYHSSLAPKLNLYNGWDLRGSNTYFPTVLSEIKETFRPNCEIEALVMSRLHQYKSLGYFIVGIHARRGDYKNFMGGVHYYEWTEYMLMMKQLELQLSGKKVCFFIASNEKYDNSLFKDYVLIDSTGFGPIHDLYGLCLSDCIVGPPSTFSCWASFYGQKPVCFINKEIIQTGVFSFSTMKGFFKTF